MKHAQGGDEGEFESKRKAIPIRLPIRLEMGLGSCAVMRLDQFDQVKKYRTVLLI